MRPKPLDPLLAAFSARSRARLVFHQLPQALKAPSRHFVLSNDDRFLFIKNSKAGCSTVAQVLHHYSNNRFANDNVHLARHELRQRIDHWPLAQRLMRSPGTVVFTFVRDPAVRVLSAFKDFFLAGRSNASERHLAPLRQRGFDRDGQPERQFSIFLGYITESLEADRMRTDRHLRPQVTNIAHRTIDYAHIGRLEHYADDLRHIFKLADREQALESIPLDRRFNASPEMTFAVSAEQRRTIEEIYAEDYEAFGY